MLVGQPVDEGHEEIETRGQRGVVFAEALDHPGMLLRHDLDRAGHEDGGDDEDDEGDFHGASVAVDKWWL